jgi:hypothetical protein
MDDVRDGMAEREDEIHSAFTAGVAIDEFGDFDPEEGSYR